MLIVAPHHPPETLAGAVRLGSLASELAALGHDVVVVAPGASEGADEAAGAGSPRVHRVTLPPRGRGALGNALHQLALRRALARGVRAAMSAGARPDVVLVSTPPPIAALAGRAFARRAGLPLIVDVRDIWPDVLIEADALGARSPAAFVLRLVERRLLGAAAGVSVVTATKQERLRARCAAPIALVPNGVDAAWCDGGEPYAGGGDAGDFEALHAGNVGLAQDVGLLARAVTLAAPGSRRIRALIVGAGEDIEAVRAAARSAGDAVTMLPPEPRLAVRARLARTGCAFVSLRTARLVDAVPSKLLEAMGRGVPVIACVAGEAAAIVHDAGAGFVSPPGDAAALARNLERMASLTSEERKAMGRRGREAVLAHHRREDAARRMSALLREACAARVATPQAARAGA